MKRILTILTLLFFVSSCENKMEMPKDFWFYIETESVIINSLEGSFNLKSGKTDTIGQLTFSEKELKEIFYEFKNNRLDNLPLEFKTVSNISSLPYFETKMNYRINGKIYRIDYNSNCEIDFFQFRTRYRIKRIQKSINKVFEIINSKKGFENFSRTDSVIYM